MPYLFSLSPPPGGEPRLEVTLLVNPKDSPETNLLPCRPVLWVLIRYSPVYLSDEVHAMKGLGHGHLCPLCLI